MIEDFDMKRIAILGCENSHANAFLKCIRDLPEFSDIEVFGVYSRETEAAELLREKFGVPVLSDYSEAVGKIDGLIITARHGDDHLTFAEPYIGTGIPMFIDKPITVTEEDALSLARSLKECRVKVCGGSSLKQDATVRKLKKAALEATGGKTVGGYVRAPYYSDSVYGGFYFYAQHLG